MKGLLALGPVRKTLKPRYPSNDQVKANPSILLENVPESWLTRKEIMCALVILTLSGAAACTSKDNTAVKGKILVAPVFAHGSGQGSIGCVAVNPPIFLSEEEVRQIVTDEFAKRQVVFDVKGKVLMQGHHFPVVDLFGEKTPEDMKKSYAKIENELKLDGYSSKYNLGYEYISKIDHKKFGGAIGSGGTSSSFDFKAVAKNLVKEVGEQGKINFVAFYDPLLNPMQSDINNEKITTEMSAQDRYKRDLATYAELRLKSRQALKQQIQDFFDWASSEGML